MVGQKTEVTRRVEAEAGEVGLRINAAKSQAHGSRTHGIDPKNHGRMQATRDSK
jgi:hypothetical protein